MANDRNRNSLTNWPGATDSGWDPVNDIEAADWDRNENFRDVIDYEDRESDPDPISYFVLANDINTIKDAIFSLQEVLGLDPGISTLDGSIDDLTTRLAYLEGEGLTSKFDVRYGGVPVQNTYGSSWSTIYTNNVGLRPRLTILGHLHDGILNSKISLTSHVTGLLPRANLNLTTAGTTGTHIFTDTNGTETIATALANCLRIDNTSAQTIEGDVIINGNFSTKVFKEADIKDSMVGGYSFSADTGAYTGNSFIASTSTANGTFFQKDFADTRFWRYSIGVRSKVSANALDSAVARITVSIPGGATLKTFDIKPNMYNGTTYEVAYTDFIFSGTAGQSTIRVTISWLGNGKGVTWNADSITIVPVHLSVYDI